MANCKYGMIACRKSHREPANRTDMADMVARLRAWRHAATDADVADGGTWYRREGAAMADMAESHGITRDAGAIVAALLSPRAPWDANVEAAEAIMAGRSATGMTVLPARVALAESYVNRARTDADADPGLGTSPKVRAFACNLAGCTDCVTSDVWYVRAATGRADGALAPCGCEHAAIAEATRTVAAEWGESPADLQAIVWVAIRSVNPSRGKPKHIVPVA